MRETTNHTSCCLVTKGQVSIDKKLTWQMFDSLVYVSIFVQKKDSSMYTFVNTKSEMFFFLQTLHQSPRTKEHMKSRLGEKGGDEKTTA